MINHCAKNWDGLHQQGIAPGTMVPFIPGGLDSNKAEVLGFTRDGTQVVLMFRYMKADSKTGQYILTRRIFQRDRYTIEELTRDARRFK